MGTNKPVLLIAPLLGLAALSARAAADPPLRVLVAPTAPMEYAPLFFTPVPGDVVTVTPAPARQPNLSARFPMPVIVGDVAAFPMPVLRRDASAYPIRTVTPDGQPIYTTVPQATVPPVTVTFGPGRR